MVPNYEIFSSALVGLLLDGSGGGKIAKTSVSCHSGTELDCTGTRRSRKNFACY